MQYVKKAALRGVIPFVIMTGIALMMKSQVFPAFDVKSTFLAGLIYGHRGDLGAV